MGIEPPFLYDHPTKYSFVGPTERGFNPKAATQASWSPPRSKPTVDGPLINSKEFNRHPDSYFVVPYGNLNWKPMGPRTKSKVKWTRLVQLFLRICELLGAVGLLFCVVCITKAEGTTGWIIRLPPGIAMLHTVYAIYHLSRSSKGRIPSSSASYMLFAAMIDVGLIPFFVFTALMSRTEYIEPVNVTGHWSTLFGSDEATTKITYSTFLISVVSGSLHVVSLIQSIYLGVVFRKISRLPPDMNPLEDNLTSRHKRNKSSLLDDHRMSQATTATSSSKRGSKADDPLISPPRTVPFMHTRNESHESIARGPAFRDSPRVSRTNLSTSLYDKCPQHSAFQSNIKDSLYDQQSPQPPSRSQIQRQYDDPLPPSHSVHPNFQPIFLDENSSQQASPTEIKRSPTKSSSIYSRTTTTTITDDRPSSPRPRSTVSTLADSNWITHPSPSPSPSPPREFKHLRNKPSYQPLSQTSPFEYTSTDQNFLPKPLEMNPPTPPIQSQKRRRSIEERALSPATGNHGQPNWGSGPGMVGIGKARAWGGMGRSGGNAMGGGGRVVSRSGVQVRNDGILPSGGVRAREVSGKVMEEGKSRTGGWM